MYGIRNSVQLNLILIVDELPESNRSLLVVVGETNNPANRTAVPIDEENAISNLVLVFPHTTHSMIK